MDIYLNIVSGYEVEHYALHVSSVIFLHYFKPCGHRKVSWNSKLSWNVYLLKDSIALPIPVKLFLDNLHSPRVLMCV